jgi:NAD(P)-dependent dehydrogenase (short-subunit alcohol dehydrogenase family)
MSAGLGGKVAIVTGAGTKAPGIGIGCAIAQVLARNGATVLVVDRDGDNAKVTLGMIDNDGGTGAVCVADVSREADCEAMVVAAVETFGGLDILVNNAGISKHVVVTATTLELYEDILGVNLRGTFMACKYAIPELIARGGGSIVNIGSVAGIRDTGSSHPAYSASKGGMLGLTVDLAGEYGQYNVRVNAVLPGMIASPLQASIATISPETEKRINMLGRQGDVWDIAQAVNVLCSDELSYITGHTLPVDGGATQAMAVSALRVDRASG